jgi:hypothetical protein
MAGIIRNPRPDELDTTPITSDGNSTGFELIGYKNYMTQEEKFEIELTKQEQIASKKKLPFAHQVARADFKEFFRQLNEKIQRQGMLYSGDKTEPEMNWEKYSDLKNFDLIEEGERPDEQLTKHNPGLNVTKSFKKYQFKGYQYLYILMEDTPSAINRANKKRKETLD